MLYQLSYASILEGVLRSCKDFRGIGLTEEENSGHMYRTISMRITQQAGGMRRPCLRIRGCGLEGIVREMNEGRIGERRAAKGNGEGGESDPPNVRSTFEG